jgi:hypothetical protein
MACAVAPAAPTAGRASGLNHASGPLSAGQGYRRPRTALHRVSLPGGHRSWGVTPSMMCSR